jgi:hypothetical protein
MIQVKAGNIYYVPVRLLTSLGAPVTGVAYGTVSSVVLYFSNNTTQTLTLGASDWIEYSQGAYGLRLNPVTSIYGPLVIVVVAPGANAFVGVYDVVQNTAADATTAATTSGTASAAAQAVAQSCLNILTGGQKIDAVNNILYLYSTDNTTVLARFNLLDNNGAPTSTNIYQRNKF